MSARSVANELGNILWVDPEDARGQALIASGGNVNPPSLELWSIALGLTNWDTVIDVGSNYGEMLTGVEMPKNARIIAFEPNSAVLPYLERTVAALETSVEIVPNAVADRPGQHVPFYRDVAWSGTSGLSRKAGSGRVALDDVTVTTLDDFLRGSATSRACIKVDVEGADLAVIEGASETLGRLASWAIMIEVLHMSDEEVLWLAEQHNLFFMDRRTHRLVRFQPQRTDAVRALLDAGWIYPQDAVLTSSGDLVSMW